ncbi:transmembrane epididymal protein 1 [Monodelphis domestica]|uniref:Transmembrane epididymal protein 1-like n=1 Tax=Monodelphis domestica TaxID=13616 RepID=F7B148_MONDO|nr:transmembrane epididymal protein 1 [Monodelphis domestica]
MTDFLGHALPGVYFFFLGVYYAIQASLALLRGQQFLTPPLPPRDKRPKGWLQKLQNGGLVKVVFSIGGFLGAFFYPLGSNRLVFIDWKDPERPFLNHISWHHGTMYVLLLINGLVDIVSQCCLARQQMKLERAAFAFAIQGTILLFIFHIQGRNALQVRGHILLLIPLILIALILLSELWFPDDPVFWISKAWMFLTLGSWFPHLGSILYLPVTGQPWRADKHEDVMFLPIFFSWHLILDALLIAGIYGLCSFRHHRYLSHQGAKGAGYQLCSTDISTEEVKTLMV